MDFFASKDLLPRPALTLHFISSHYLSFLFFRSFTYRFNYSPCFQLSENELFLPRHSCSFSLIYSRFLPEYFINTNMRMEKFRLQEETFIEEQERKKSRSIPVVSIFIFHFIFIFLAPSIHFLLILKVKLMQCITGKRTTSIMSRKS